MTVDQPGWQHQFTVYGDGPEYEESMRQWMEDHPGTWHRCEVCYRWRLTSNPSGHCPLCKPKAHRRSSLHGDGSGGALPGGRTPLPPQTRQRFMH